MAHHPSAGKGATSSFKGEKSPPDNKHACRRSGMEELVLLLGELTAAGIRGSEKQFEHGSRQSAKEAASVGQQKGIQNLWYPEPGVVLRILMHIKDPEDLKACSLVCKRWLEVHDKIKRSIKVLDWAFVEGGRMSSRFPNLVDIDLTQAWKPNETHASSPPVLLSSRSFSLRLGSNRRDPLDEEQTFSPEALDRGLMEIAKAHPNLQRLALVDIHPKGTGDFLLTPTMSPAVTPNITPNISPTISPNITPTLSPSMSPVMSPRSHQKKRSSTPSLAKEMSFRFQSPMMSENGDVKDASLGEEGDVMDVRGEEKGKVGLAEEAGETRSSVEGIRCMAEKCPHLHELKVRLCSDATLAAIGHLKHLHILHLVGSPTGLGRGTFSDKGLTALAASCQRLVELRLASGAVGYEGLAAIGRNCQILSKLTLSNKGFQRGWIRALPLFPGLDTLVLDSCHKVDPDPGPLETLGTCAAIGRLHFQRCDLEDKTGYAALMHICNAAIEVEFQDCWRFTDEIFTLTGNLRNVRSLELEGCSLVTASGLQTVLSQCANVEHLKVVFCGKIEEKDMSRHLENRIAQMASVTWQPRIGSWPLKAGSHLGFGMHDASLSLAHAAIANKVLTQWRGLSQKSE